VAKAKSEDNLQGDSSFSGLQNMLFLVSYLAQVAKHQMRCSVGSAFISV